MRFRCWFLIGIMLMGSGPVWRSAAVAGPGKRTQSGRVVLHAPHHPFASGRRPLAPKRDTGCAAMQEVQKLSESGTPNPTSAGPTVTPDVKRPSQPTTSPEPPADVFSLASPLTAEQQARLAELLERYKADQITPEEYHRERQRILQTGTPAKP
ncbi:MAG: SHOCT domain-containing protein [Verrucomicrobiota bacterium]|nr:SHOCT domain-containing protein [Verrucomicrobiota bacterium]